MAHRLAWILVAALLAGCPSGTEEGPDSSTKKQDAGRLDAAGDEPDTGTVAADAGTAGADAASSYDAGGQGTPIAKFWATTQWPPYLTLAPGAKAMVYGQVWVEGGTDKAGAMAGLTAELGAGAPGSDPASWTWKAASFNKDSGNNDEYQAELEAPASGTLAYAYRFRVTGAVWEGKGEWLYAGLKGPTLTEGEAGLLAVRGAKATVKVATQNLMCIRETPTARFDALVARWKTLDLDLVTLQEVCEDAAIPGKNTAAYLAQALTTATGKPWRQHFVQTHKANDKTPEGLGLLTWRPIAATATADLPSQEFPRKALLAVVATPAGMLAAVSTHYSFRDEDAAYRVQQAQAVLKLVDEWQGASKPAGTLALVGGDFNTAPNTDPVKVFLDASPAFLDSWAVKNPGNAGNSYPSHNPTVRIDYLLPRGFEVAAANQEFTTPYTGTSYVSDHVGFAVTLTGP